MINEYLEYGTKELSYKYKKILQIKQLMGKL